MEESEFAKMSRFEGLHWWYRARKDLLMGLIPGTAKTMLEVGCGTGNNLAAAQKKGLAVEGIEPDKKSARLARQKGLSIQNTVLEKFFSKKKYDVVLAADVLEHIKDDASAIRKMKKMLEKNGCLLLTVPAFQFLFSRHDELCHHHRRYGKKELVAKLEDAGLEVCFVSHWNFFLFAPVAAAKILKKHFGKNAESDIHPTPEPVNSVLESILRIENLAIKKRLYLPIGTSLVCAAKPKNS